MQPTMDREQATERVERHISTAVAQLPGTARLEPMGRTDSLPCDAPDDGGPAGRVIVEHQYAIRGLSPRDNQRWFDTVRDHWEEQEYRQLSYHKRGARWVMVYTDADGFRIRLATSVRGDQLTIRSQSPCIWPDGNPPTGAA